MSKFFLEKSILLPTILISITSPYAKEVLYHDTNILFQRRSAYRKRVCLAHRRYATGVDENSQKVVESAENANMSVMDYADMMAVKHRDTWDALGVRYSDFIRTTEPRHHEFIKKVLQKSFDNGDIYE